MIKGVARDWPIYGFIAVYFGVVSFVVHHFGGGMPLIFGIYNSTLMTILCLLAGAFFVYRIFFVMIRLRPDRLTRTILTDFKTFLEPRRVVPGVLLILAFPLFFVPFGAFKSAIPILNGFSWDPAFAEWDRWLHGGTDPWLLLQPLLGTPRLTTVVNFFYHA